MVSVLCQFSLNLPQVLKCFLFHFELTLQPLNLSIRFETVFSSPEDFFGYQHGSLLPGRNLPLEALVLKGKNLCQTDR